MIENGDWRSKREGSVDGKIGWRPSFTSCLTTAAIRSPTVFSCDGTTCTAPTLPCIVTFKSNSSTWVSPPTRKLQEEYSSPTVVWQLLQTPELNVFGKIELSLVGRATTWVGEPE
ncbi:hypothetical protein SLEP1_g20425 [Rubroshorea leprosula]|uniref:Uncharacterized protein n=1 Tax=Rubroshorea leprosula TaxID=152421 RepID=A0AAV5J2P8_9ROSI|nr:hypothetical protein SLEP1_g20425 [Rubroshorea leprosula]